MMLRETLLQWKQYSKMSDLAEIARRKFFNNCFDGALTCAGIVSGVFILFLSGSSNFAPKDVLVTGFATALAIGISGLWGAFLSEEAERKKKMLDMKKEMAIIDEEEMKTNKTKEGKVKQKKKDQKIEEIQYSKQGEDMIIDKSKSNKKKKTPLLEKAENFATIIASLVDGGAPVLGSSLPLIPFFFGLSLAIIHFIFSYIILTALLIYLGIFLGKISGGGRVKYAMHLVTAGVVTLLVSILLGI